MAIPYVWNGSVWTATQAINIWTGSVWTATNIIKVWTGTTWLDTDLDSPLDTQIVTVGYDSGSIDFGFGVLNWSYSGYSSTGQIYSNVPFGSIADGTSNIYAGAAITQLYTDDINQTLNLEITGATNSGWTFMYVNNAQFSRSAASFSSGAWIWNSVNNSIWTNPTTTIRFI